MLKLHEASRNYAIRLPSIHEVDLCFPSPTFLHITEREPILVKALKAFLTWSRTSGAVRVLVSELLSVMVVIAKPMSLELSRGSRSPQVAGGAWAASESAPISFRDSKRRVVVSVCSWFASIPLSHKITSQETV